MIITFFFKYSDSFNNIPNFKDRSEEMVDKIYYHFI